MTEAVPCWLLDRARGEETKEMAYTSRSEGHCLRVLGVAPILMQSVQVQFFKRPMTFFSTQVSTPDDVSNKNQQIIP